MFDTIPDAIRETGRFLLGCCCSLWIGATLHSDDYDPNAQWHLGYLGELVGGLIYMIGYYRTITAKGYTPLIALVGFTGFIGLIVIAVLPAVSRSGETSP